MPNQYTHPWTEQEQDQLIELLGSYSFEIIAKKLNRTIGAIESQVERMKLSALVESGKINAHMLSVAFDIQYKVLYRWRDQFGLPLKKKKLRSSKRTKQASLVINAEEFWKWADKHRHLINFRNYKPFSILPEPEWLEEQIRLDYQTIPKRQRREYTKQEDETLIRLYLSGMKQKDIAKQLERTHNSVERRLKRLRNCNVLA